MWERSIKMANSTLFGRPRLRTPERSISWYSLPPIWMTSPWTVDNMGVRLALGIWACTWLPFLRPANQATQQGEESAGFMRKEGRLRESHRPHCNDSPANTSQGTAQPPTTKLVWTSRRLFFFWGGGEDGWEEAFFDVMLFNPFAASYCTSRWRRCISVMGAKSGLTTKSGLVKWRGMQSLHLCSRWQEEPAS